MDAYAEGPMGENPALQFGARPDVRKPSPALNWPPKKKPQQLPGGYQGGAGHGPMQFSGQNMTSMVQQGISPQTQEALANNAAWRASVMQNQQGIQPVPQQPATQPQMAPQPRPQAQPVQPAVQPGNQRQPAAVQPNLAQQQGQHQQAPMWAPMQGQGHANAAMHNQGMGQYQHAIKSTNDAIAAEMQSRVDQARDYDRMAHEEQMAGMRHQADMERLGFERESRNQELAHRDAKNAALMRAAGIGGIHLVNGKPVDPFSSIRSSLLG